MNCLRRAHSLIDALRPIKDGWRFALVHNNRSYNLSIWPKLIGFHNWFHVCFRIRINSSFWLLVVRFAQSKRTLIVYLDLRGFIELFCFRRIGPNLLWALSVSELIMLRFRSCKPNFSIIHRVKLWELALDRAYIRHWIELSLIYRCCGCNIHLNYIENNVGRIKIKL